jgi:hypothetical protein
VFDYTISDGLKDLISSQNNLKYLTLTQLYNNGIYWTEILLLLTKNLNTIVKLHLQVEGFHGPLSFITKLTNLEELVLTIDELDDDGFIGLQSITLTKLQILKFDFGYPKVEILIKFLENSGKNLKKLYVDKCDGLAITKFCPKLKLLHIIFNYDKAEELELIFNIFQQLESIESINELCGNAILQLKEMFIIAKISKKNSHELKLLELDDPENFIEDLSSVIYFLEERSNIKFTKYIFSAL